MRGYSTNHDYEMLYHLLHTVFFCGKKRNKRLWETNAISIVVSKNPKISRSKYLIVWCQCWLYAYKFRELLSQNCVNFDYMFCPW